MDMGYYLSIEALVALVTLTSLEIVLGIDNIVFIAVVAGRLPKEDRNRARLVGLSLAVFTRVMLLLVLMWFMTLTSPLFTLAGHGVSGKDLILLLGGLFLIGKATHEIHLQFIDEHHEDHPGRKRPSFWWVIVQILAIDIIFSLDSVITAVGMARNLGIMVAAILIAVGIMLIFSKVIVNFVNHYPTIRTLALSFLLLVGVMLVAEGTGRSIEKGYLYFAMAFSLFVDLLNLKLIGKPKAVEAH